MAKLGRLYADLVQLSKDSEIGVLRLLGAFIICRFIHGASWDNFRVLEMFKYKNAELRKVYTFKRQKRVSDALNRGASDEELHTIMDKNLFNSAFNRFIVRDWYDASKPNIEKLKEFLDNNDKFLIKPVLSSCGKGIRLMTSSDVSCDELFEELKGENVILEGFISQHSEMNRINPTSVNTVRIITMRVGDFVHIVGAAIRCGGKDSFVDNFHNGGSAFSVDIETGIIAGPGCTLGKIERVIAHPATGTVVCGFQVPNWQNVIETVRAAAMVMKNVGYIGWDIAVLADGCEIIEANVNYPGTNIIQLDGFSAYRKVKDFLQQHNI